MPQQTDSDPRFSSPLAAELGADALERFLRYVRIDTQSDHDSQSTPSTAKQLDLSRVLVEDLRALGLEDAELDQHGVVLATLPGTAGDAVPALGLIAHVDTTPDVSGAGVEPLVHRNWDGSPITLPADERQVLDPAQLSELGQHVGHDIVTASGPTLLGADDKAGVAEIVAAVAYLTSHPELHHGPLRVAFTPDEEIGRGAANLDKDRLGAAAAFTLDGSTAGEIQDETFSASKVTVTFRGVNMHPGFAKGELVNAVKLAADFVAALPRDRLSPETTDARAGFVHPVSSNGTASAVTVGLIVRDFDDAQLAAHEQLLRKVANEVTGRSNGASVDVHVERQYTNMKARLSESPELIDAADEAIRRAGLEPNRTSIRGGTDGTLLTAKGLPTPNLFTGGHEFHSEREWICVQDLGAATATIVELAQVWAELAVRASSAA